MKIKDENMPPHRAIALVRYQVISPYIALEPPRGQRRQVLRQLAARSWAGPDGEPFTTTAETIRVWVRKYRKKGLEGLEDKPRLSPGVKALTPEQVDLVCKLKKEVPERSVERIIAIMEDMDFAAPGTLRRSTVHRVLKQEGLSARACRIADRADLDRFEADVSNDLWHSDMLTGPFLPDPQHPTRMRRAYLYAFIDDHSRRLLHGRFSFKGDLPALELVFRRALGKYGAPRRLYYDNAMVYRSDHMKQIVASLGIHRIIHTQPYRPMGNGKIEALNRLIRAAFLAELKASTITTLDQLNEAFIAWTDLKYNTRPHGETGQTPKERYQKGLTETRYIEEETLRQAFLWREKRTPDKAGVFSLWGIPYQVGPQLARRRIEVRFDPEALAQVEIWHEDRFVERVRPFSVGPHRRPKPDAVQRPAPKDDDKAKPVADWLGELVKRRRAQTFIAPTRLPDADRDEKDQLILDLLFDQLEEDVVEQPTVLDYLRRYGPFDLDVAHDIITAFLKHNRKDLHVTVYLDAIREAHRGASR